MRKTVIAGCGSICHDQWMKPIKNFHDIQIVGLVDLNLYYANKIVEEFNLNPLAIGTDLSAIIKKTNADTVFDCTIPSARKSIVMTAISNGCDVLAEKPMAVSIDDAWEMIDQAEGHQKTYAIVQNRRYTENIIQYRDMIRSGAVGRLTTLNADFYIGAHFDGFRNEMQHVLLFDMAIHCFDEARFIGDLEPVSVYCHDWNPHGSWYQHGASAMAIFEMTDDVIFSFRGSWCSEGIDTSWDCAWKALGNGGTLLWDGFKKIQGEEVADNQGFIRPKRKIKIAPMPDLKYPGHSGVISEFLDSLESAKDPQTVCTDNIKSLAMVFAAIESAETGKKVNIKTKK